MHKRQFISSLPAFLGISLAFLWITFPEIQTEIFHKQQYTSVTIPLQQHLDISDFNARHPYIKLPNPNYTLYYSEDGGDTYKKAPGSRLEIDALNNTSVLYAKTSLRWRNPEGDFPTVKNCWIKLRNEKNRKETNGQPFTFYDTTISQLPIVHISIKNSDLFGWKKGIMHHGAAGNQDEGFYKNWWYRSANYANRGHKWERNATVQLIKNGEIAFDQATVLKISGNATRAFPQKSLKFYPLAKNGKRDKLHYPIWGKKGAKTSESFLLRQSGNDNSKTLFADLLMHELAQESNVLTLDGYPVSVYINGDYWGIYNLRERLDAHFIAKAENRKGKDITILEADGYNGQRLLKTGSEKEKMAFQTLMKSLPTNKKLTSEGYKAIADQISIKSFIDYIIFETFYANQDWLHNNTTWYKAADKDWKWLLNDLDFSLAYPGDENIQANLFDQLQAKTAITGQLFSALITFPKFKKKFKKRASELMENNFSDENIERTFYALKKQYETEIDQHIRRWRFIKNRMSWEQSCTDNLNFLKNRRAIYLKQVEEL